MNDLTLITCSFNTPDITLTMLRSWMSVHNSTQRLVLVDNSTDDKTKGLLFDNKIPYTSRPGLSHGQGVNEALKLCKTKYALLVDTDVIFLKNHTDIFEQFKSMDLAIMGKVEGDRGGKKIYNRVNPWHCFIDVERIKEHGITFFNEEKMKNSFKTDKIYDIGSTFLEDIKKAGLKIGNVDLEKNYFLHLEGMSWYKNKFNPNQEDTGIDFGGTHNNSAFVQVYDQKYNYFKELKKRYDDIKVSNKFIYEEPILLVKFPTRERKEKFFTMLDKYYKLLSGKNNVKFLITCDSDDNTMNNDEVKEKFKTYKNLTVEYGNSKSKIEACNVGLDSHKFQIVLLASDDMEPVIKGYDSIIIDGMCKNFPDFDGVLWFNDGFQGNRLNTLCILGHTYYNRFNYIYHPIYKSLYCDAEFTIVSQTLNKVKYFNDVIIKHVQYSIVKEEPDQLYLRNDGLENIDKLSFLQRQKINFDLK